MPTIFQDVDSLLEFMHDIMNKPYQYHDVLWKFYENGSDVVKRTLVDDCDGKVGKYTTTTDFPEYKDLHAMIKQASVLYARLFYAEDEKKIQETIAAQDAREKKK